MNVPELFGEYVFSRAVMKERLPRKVYQELVRVMEQGGSLSPASADTIADAMKCWAVEKGATHYTHWFQPLTGTTAEKHDAFLSLPDEEGRVLMELSGKKLIMGETDASSFPSGGLRGTSYARGYTAWDITSPAFIKKQTCGTVLCIPTVFASYTGEALDSKTPLLRSMEAVSRQGVRLLRLFGDESVKHLTSFIGPEQEYFLIERKLYEKRKDLLYTGRTLFGAPAPKGQELDDHYFGKIRTRVGTFMSQLNQELWRYGIPAITQHNEVAPAQHELAPFFAMANVAVDQNNLIMETMKQVAYDNGMSCLLHEKPYAGVNGSAKHNNWSIGTDTGENLFDPGEDPEHNLRFQLILACVVSAIDRHAPMLRETAATAGNDHRLGAQEAPPAIISIFLGDQLEALVDRIVTGRRKDVTAGELDTGVSTVPVLHKDATDRNRTSPFAFTGNRFEFRMVGSSDNVATSTTALNTIMAEAFCDAADALENATDFESACRAYIKELFLKHKRVVFNGDGYSDAWVAEAERRGLPIIRSTVDAISALTSPETVETYGKFSVFTPTELASREEIRYEVYAKKIAVESKVMIHMAGKQYIPSVINYASSLSDAVASAESIGVDASVQREILNEITYLLRKAQDALNHLKQVYRETDAMDDLRKMAQAYRHVVIPAMDALRSPIDQLEMVVDSDFWPVPSYGDLMYNV